MDTKYVAYETTLAELIELANKHRTNQSTHTDTRMELYSYKAKHTKHPLTEDDINAQYDHKWQSQTEIELYVYGGVLEEHIRGLMYQIVKEKCTGDVPKELHNRVMNSNIREVVVLNNRPNGSISINRDTELGGERNEYKYTYEYDTHKMEEQLDDAKVESGWSRSETDQYVYLDTFTVNAYDYRVERWATDIPKIEKKVLSKELTYCMKNGKLIIPGFYAEKGEDGIKEWQELKRSTNKNNSMEKRTVKQLLRDKKMFASDCAYKTMRAVTSINNDWTIPQIEIDGRWNKTKVTKFVSTILKDKTEQQILSMTDEYILDKVKKHWKNVLMEAYRAVDNLTTESK